MTSKITLAAQARAKAGKGAARATRRTGQIPAVIYGDNKDALLISITEKELVMATKKGSFFTSLCDLEVDGKKHLVMPRDVQLDGVTDRPLHADFLRVTDKTIVRVKVPVRVINHKDCPGLNKGGVLNLVSHEIEVACAATKIPEEFVLDLTGLEVGSSLHVEHLNIPKEVKPTRSGNFTVVTLVAPSAMKSDGDAAANAAAPAAAAPAAAAPAAAAKK